MIYTSTRPRGLAAWNPHAKNRALLDQVESVLAEYAEHLPLTVRQVFYRLVGAHGYEKDDRAYGRLCEMMVRARRAELIPFDSIRDDGVSESRPPGFRGLPGFWSAVEDAAAEYRRVRTDGQPVALELWCESGGMVPQLVQVAEIYGVPVFSSGGFDSLTAKYETAKRIARENRPTIIVSVGDLDPSGVSIFESFTEDVRALATDLGCANDPDFVRAAVTREQVERFNLPSAPAKRTDRRGDWQGGTVQAEALAPGDLAAEVVRVLRSLIDRDVLDQTFADEEQDRELLLSRLPAAGRVIIQDGDGS